MQHNMKSKLSLALNIFGLQTHFNMIKSNFIQFVGVMVTNNDLSVWRWMLRCVCQFTCWVQSPMLSDLLILQSILGSFHTMQCFKPEIPSGTHVCYMLLDRKNTFYPINQKLNKDVQSWCDSISEGGTIMHRQTGLTVFFGGLWKQFVQW